MGKKRGMDCLVGWGCMEINFDGRFGDLGEVGYFCCLYSSKSIVLTSLAQNP
jgi:hypothetical protein